MISGQAMLAGVIGWPVGHSLSPKLHNRWIEEAALDAAYVPLAVMPENLAEALRGLPRAGFRGFNLTVPHKEAALWLLDEVDAVAQAIGAVNTVIVCEGKLLGTNTDHLGFIHNLQAKAGDLAPFKRRTVVIGAGGAARAVVYGLRSAGFEEIVITNRTQARAETLASQFDAEVVAWEKRAEALEGATLVINASSLGLAGRGALDLSLDALPKESLVADVVYTPLMTDLLVRAKAQGNPVATGLGMLVYQAAPGFAAWFGRKPAIAPGLEEWLLS